jgi:L-fucose mutarotase
MLLGISPLISPNLLAVLHRMGHGDEIVQADAHFPGDQLDPLVEASYRQAIHKHWPDTPPIKRIDRSDFYERGKLAFAVLMTGETVKYGNIILKSEEIEL